MAPILYFMPESPPSRAVLLTIRYLNIDIELKLCRTYMNEHLEPAFLKINPQRTVPFLDDNGFHLSESRAISSYLIETRKPESNLLGRFPKKRAVINQRMQYDLGTFGPCVAKIVRPITTEQSDSVPIEVQEKLYQCLEHINSNFLMNAEWIAGDHITIADFFYLTLIATLNSMDIPLKEKYPNIWAWYERCKTLPGYEENEEGARAIGNVFKDKLKVPLEH